MLHDLGRKDIMPWSSFVRISSKRALNTVHCFLQWRNQLDGMNTTTWGYQTEPTRELLLI